MVSDDVQVGQLVAVVKHRCSQGGDCDAQFTGAPFRVVQVSLPFAVLEDCSDGSRCPIDLRQWELGRVSREYVAALLGTAARPRRRRTEESESDDVHKRCVRCGERMVQRLVRRCWKWHCEQCKVDGEAVVK